MQAKVAVLAGDGVGPEVIAEARKVLQAVAQRFDHDIALVDGLIGGIAIDETGDPLPGETLDLCRRSDAVLLGAVGGPKWDDPSASVRPEQGLLGLRQGLGLFANLRPVRVHPSLTGSGPLRRGLVENVDLLVVRELTGGIYFGRRGREPHPSGEQAFDTMIYSTGEIERVVRVAGNAARSRRNRLTSVDKANVLEVSRLWRATADRVLKEEFPDVEVEHLLVDAAAMHLIQQPARFDVIVTGNMFGDILTDEASVLAGSMGMLGSASIGQTGPSQDKPDEDPAGRTRPGLYEPIHGSAPDIAGRGIANPIGMILSAAMMCRESLGWPEEAACIESAVDRVITDGVRTVDLTRDGDDRDGQDRVGQNSVGTAEMGTAIAKAIQPAESPTRVT